MSCFSNGFTEVFTNTSDAKNSKSEIDFEICVNSISVDTFNHWKIQITELLGKEIISLIEAEIISLANGGKFKFEQYMPMYSLLVAEYALNGDFNIKKYFNKSNIPVDCNLSSSNKCNPILESIYKLESSMVHFQGKIIVKDLHPESKAYIPVTFFKFSDHKIVSFVAYNGPVTIINQSGATEKSHTYTQIQQKEVLENVL